MEFQLSYFKSSKMRLCKCCTQYASKFWKLSNDCRIAKFWISFQSHTEKPGAQQSIASQRVRPDLALQDVWLYVSDYTSLWLSRSLRSFLYSSSMYSCHLFLISSASVSSIPFLSFIEPIFAWNVTWVSLIFLKRSLVFPVLLFSSFFALIAEEGFPRGPQRGLLACSAEPSIGPGEILISRTPLSAPGLSLCLFFSARAN